MQWALAYAAATWVLLQVLSLLASTYEWPPAVMRVAVAVGVLGFFVALVLAWFHGERGTQKVSGTELLILSLLLATGGTLLWRVSQGSRESAAVETRSATDARSGAAAAPAVPDKSIAVLPFENLSDDKSSGYFAAGIQDEILSRLVGVGDLKVISRTSTEKYKSRPDNLRTVASELGVANVLEGSVQKAGDKVRVNVQLIDARVDAHLWASIYDRDLQDVFAVESDVAQNIVEALKAKLSASETQTLAAVPTQNSDAYDLFLRAEYESHLEANGTGAASGPYDRAIDLYRRAITLDPQFALAYARLANAQLQRHWYIKSLTAADLAEIKATIDRALALQPDLAYARATLALYYYWGFRDYDAALAELDKVLKVQPSNSEALEVEGGVYRRQGRWAAALAAFERAGVLAPRDAAIASDIGSTLVLLRRYDEGERALLRSLALDPQNMQSRWDLDRVYVNGHGDIERARHVYDGVPPGPVFGGDHVTGEVGAIDVRIYLDVLQRRFADALNAWTNAPTTTADERLRRLFGLVTVRLIAGQKAQAHDDCVELGRVLAGKSEHTLDEPMRQVAMAWVQLCDGRNDEAVRLAEHARDLLPLERDAFYGTVQLASLAQVEAHAGKRDEAIAIIGGLLAIPGWSVTVERLKLDPVWDPIRDDPRFVAFTKRPVTEYKVAPHG